MIEDGGIQIICRSWGLLRLVVLTLWLVLKLSFIILFELILHYFWLVLQPVFLFHRFWVIRYKLVPHRGWINILEQESIEWRAFFFRSHPRANILKLGNLILRDLGWLFHSTFVDLDRGFYTLHGHTHVFLLLFTIWISVRTTHTCIDKPTTILKSYRTLAFIFRISDTASCQLLFLRSIELLLQICFLLLLYHATILMKLLFFVDITSMLHVWSDTCRVCNLLILTENLFSFLSMRIHLLKFPPFRNNFLLLSNWWLHKERVLQIYRT